ncbi:hypothetical protein JCM3766R1_005947 [Sporobolomyces carnicolor]
MSISHAQASVAFLSGADDLLSRLLLDYCIFAEPRLDGRATGKINKNVRELRMSDAEVERAKALVRGLRSGSVSLTKGLETLLEFPSVDSFAKKWDDVPLFSGHARRYILAMRPDCGIAFHETDRYKNPRAGVTARAKKNLAAVTSRRDPASFIEVGVFATRNFKKGEVINLRGGIADLTEEEDDEMRLSGGRSDFSVLWSERKNCFCLLLGPARFVNHDCRNNVEFNLVGSNMSFKAVEDIKKDEELFTHYGAHYFETDNAACLCATCEQLQQGAFTPLNKRKKIEPETPEPASPVVSRTRRNSSPGPGSLRSSARTSKLPPVNYDENASVASTSASAVLAQRGIAKSAALTRSRSVGSSKTRPRPPSSRTMPVRGALSVVDALRGKPRLLVQPKLAPPPGYSEDYLWDEKQRSAKYVGPQFCKDDDEKKAKPSLSRSNSSVSLAKRRRLASDSPAAPTPSPRSKPVAVAPPRIRPTSANRQKKKPRVGERRSSRLSVGTTPVKAKKMKPRAQREKSSSLSGAGESDEDESMSEARASDDEESQSEAEEIETDNEEAEEEEEEEEEEVIVRRDKGKGKAVASGEDNATETSTSPAPFAMPTRVRSGRSLITYGRSGRTRSRSTETPASSVSGNAHLRTVTLDLGFSTSTPMEEDSALFSNSHGSEDEADSKKAQSKPSPVPNDDPRLPPDRPRRPISSPNFYSNQKATDGGGGGGGGGGGAASNPNGPSDESSFCEAPSSAGTSGRGSYSQAVTGAHNGASNGRGSGSGSGGDDDDAGDGKKRGIPSDKMEDGADESEHEEEEEDRKPVIDRNEEGAGATSGAQEDSGAAATPLLPPKPADSASATPPSAPGSSAASSSAQDAGSASTVRRGKRPMQSCEREASSQALAPPKVKKARLEASASSEEPAPRARKNIRWGKGKPGVRPPTVPPPPPRDPGKFEVPRPRPERSPMESRSENEPAIAAAVPEPVPARPKSPAPRAPQAPVQPVASRPTVVTGRQTRSKPIPGRLEDVLSAPETLAATGGYDWEKGRYITKHEQLRAPSSNPRPERRQTASPSPPPSPRRRRRRSSVIVAPAPMPSASPVASTSSLPPPVAKKARRSDSPGAAKPASRRRVTLSPVASASRLPVPSASAPPAPAAVPPEGRRATRRSFPIAGGLKDVIYSSSALAATGGWDEESGRYVGAASQPVAEDSASSSSASSSSRGARKPPSSTTRHAKSTTERSPSLSAPCPPAKSTASREVARPPGGTPDGAAARSTRRSNPINQRLEQLVYSSAVGGWDPEKGKYVSQVAARKAAQANGGVSL